MFMYTHAYTLICAQNYACAYKKYGYIYVNVCTYDCVCTHALVRKCAFLCMCTHVCVRVSETYKYVYLPQMRVCLQMIELAYIHI